MEKTDHSAAFRIQEAKFKKDSRLSVLDKLALVITRGVGSMGFFLLIFTWTILWLAWNTLGPVTGRFDPFPAFVLWLFISNFIQLMLMPLIMVGQNLQGRYSEKRAEADFEVNVKAEIQNEIILRHLARQEKIMTEILAKLDAPDL